MPFVTSRSLCATGSPCNGPIGSPAERRRSAARAHAAIACSGSRVTIALTLGLTRSICSRCARITLSQDTSRARIRRTSSVADAKAVPGSSLQCAVKSRTDLNAGHAARECERHGTSQHQQHDRLENGRQPACALFLFHGAWQVALVCSNAAYGLGRRHDRIAHGDLRRVGEHFDAVPDASRPRPSAAYASLRPEETPSEATCRSYSSLNTLVCRSCWSSLREQLARLPRRCRAHRQHSRRRASAESSDCSPPRAAAQPLIGQQHDRRALPVHPHVCAVPEHALGRSRQASHPACSACRAGSRCAAAARPRSHGIMPARARSTFW